MSALQWSPDGRMLAFSRTSGDGKRGTLHNELDVIGVDGKGARSLHDNPAPSGAARAVVVARQQAHRLQPRRVPPGNGLGRGRRARPADEPARRCVDSDPIWSPDGQLIAFTRFPSRGVSDVWLVRPNGTGLRRLTTTPIPPQGVARVGSTPLAWSPDATQLLAFRHDRFSIVDVATRASRDLKRVGIQYALLDGALGLGRTRRTRATALIASPSPGPTIPSGFRLWSFWNATTASSVPVRSPRRPPRRTTRAASAPAEAS